MIEPIHWWEGGAGAIVAGLVGALVGSFIPVLWNYHTRNTERKGELVAMQAELRYAYLALRALLDESILAPLYMRYRSPHLNVQYQS